MQDLTKKYFWLLGVIAVIVCAMFSAMAVNHYVEGKYLAESAEPAKNAPRARQAKPKPTTLSKIGLPLAKRNMFCSECEPLEPVADDLPTDEAGDSVPLTSLPLTLIATNVSTYTANSFATIHNSNSERQGAYWISDVIPEAGPIEAIRGKYVDFRNAKNNNRLERIALLGKAAPKTKVTPKAKGKKPKGGKRAELRAAIDEGIKKVDDTHYEIDRALVDKLLANPMSVARGARVVPSIKNGKANGFKLYAIRPNSIYGKLGLMNGDTIHAVNGFELTTPDKALEVYTKVKTSSNLSVSVTRRGKPVNLGYNIQ
jgi:general secretion pathway protein C